MQEASSEKLVKEKWSHFRMEELAVRNLWS